MERIKFHGSSHHQAVLMKSPIRSIFFPVIQKCQLFHMDTFHHVSDKKIWSNVVMNQGIHVKNIYIYIYTNFYTIFFYQFRYFSFVYQGSMVFSKCAVLLAFRTLLLAAFNSAKAAAMAPTWRGAVRGAVRGAEAGVSSWRLGSIMPWPSIFGDSLSWVLYIINVI